MTDAGADPGRPPPERPTPAPSPLERPAPPAGAASAPGASSPSGSTSPRPPELPPVPSIVLHGVRLHAITERECGALIGRALAAGRGGWVVTPNLDYFHRLVRDKVFARLCGEADLLVADGMPLIWASRLQGTPLPERVAGSNLIVSVSQAVAPAGRSIFLLGGNPGTAERAGEILAARFEGLRVAGSHCPPFGFERDQRAVDEVRERLRAAAPDIVFVALGAPKQERLIAALRAELPGAWWIGVGISFSFVTGEVKRAPGWMQRGGLEWLYRLKEEPRRLAYRYLVRGIPFAVTLLARAALQRLSRSGDGRRPDEAR
ncbi:MAG: WecB/TagA/CpsF family glycosyltransferase [Planctomycetes bacterium]|nr:WecB/TagA/CpsF family glycosyltransferase [Planctomycetota bacterium]